MPWMQSVKVAEALELLKGAEGVPMEAGSVPENEVLRWVGEEVEVLLEMPYWKQHGWPPGLQYSEKCCWLMLMEVAEAVVSEQELAVAVEPRMEAAAEELAGPKAPKKKEVEERKPVAAAAVLVHRGEEVVPGALRMASGIPEGAEEVFWRPGEAAPSSSDRAVVYLVMMARH